MDKAATLNQGDAMMITEALLEPGEVVDLHVTHPRIIMREVMGPRHRPEGHRLTLGLLLATDRFMKIIRK